MRKHQVDVHGFPVDPEIRKLEEHLCILRSAWSNAITEAEEREIELEYHHTMDKLYSLGWDDSF